MTGTSDREKGGFETFMLKEIHEQASALATRWRPRRLGRRPRPTGRTWTSSILDGLERVTIVSCGTSYHAGLLAVTRARVARIARPM